MLSKLLFTLSIFLLVPPTFASDSPKPLQKYYSFGEPEVTADEVQFETDAELIHTLGTCDESKPAFSSNELTPDAISKIVNTGLKIWEVIEKNKPVVNISSKSANALPYGINCWDQLENWQRPRSQVFHVNYKNLYGFNVVSFSYKLIYTFGGQAAEKGQYLANVAMLPSNVDVIWGYELNANVNVANVINLGTKTDPLAGLEFSLEWRVNTPLKDSRSSIGFFISGDGKIDKL